MLNACFLRSIGNGSALLHLNICTVRLPVIGDSKDSVGALNSVLESRYVVEIGLSWTMSTPALPKGWYLLTATVSAPRLSNAFAEGLETSLVTPRMVQLSINLASPRKAFATLPPWTPVAPNTTRTFFAAISVKFGSFRRKPI